MVGRISGSCAHPVSGHWPSCRDFCQTVFRGCNLPGPPQPLYFADVKILELFQIGVVQGKVAVQVGALSYAGQLNLDIVAAANLVPDLTMFANGMTEDLERLSARSHEC